MMFGVQLVNKIKSWYGAETYSKKLAIVQMFFVGYLMIAVGFWLPYWGRGELLHVFLLVPGIFFWSLIVGNAVVYLLLLGLVVVCFRKRLILILIANGVLSWALGASMGYKIALAALFK